MFGELLYLKFYLVYSESRVKNEVMLKIVLEPLFVKMFIAFCKGAVVKPKP